MDDRLTCAICGRGARYRFTSAESGSAADLRCLRHALFYPAVFRRALGVAAVVGTILFLINQLDIVLAGHITALVVAKILLTYLVPFSVSTYSALQINQITGGQVGPHERPR
ncbi:MAG TPA: nitrate/nitrite transporter NrtS [Ktedonobacterales bacterium]|jgi:hypothetical protein|nr:nitrate/nitrite transporter NrtS [Ktedonobacterales bacterium]